MSISQLILLIMGIPGTILVVIGLFLNRRSKRKKERCTVETTGEVIDYSFFSNHGVRVPVVEFEAKGEVHTSKLRYSGVSVISGSFVNETSIQSDKLDLLLKVKQNKHFSRNPMADLFPLGSQLRVFYDPEDPTVSYVERWAPSLVDKICMACGALIWLIGIGLAFIIK